MVSFYSFASALFRNSWLALLGTLVQFVLYDRLDFRISVRSNQAGFILLWVALVLVFTYLDEADWRVFAAIEGLIVVLVTWHLLMAQFFFVGIGAYLCLRWLVLLVAQRRLAPDRECLRLLLLLLPRGAGRRAVRFVQGRGVAGCYTPRRICWEYTVRASCRR